jgi:hypothetical protein
VNTKRAKDLHASIAAAEGQPTLGDLGMAVMDPPVLHMLLNSCWNALNDSISSRKIPAGDARHSTILFWMTTPHF